MRDSWLKWKLVAAYEVFYETRRIFLLRTRYRLRIMTYNETLRYIEENHCNIARFGDGEFGYFFGLKDTGFQRCSEELKWALLNVLDKPQANLLVCVPRYFSSLSGCNKRAKTYWRDWGKIDNRQQKIVEFLRNKCGKEYRFGDAHLTRPYIDQKSDRRAKETYKRLKKLWEHRDLLIVEGEKTRLGVGNDLLNNARSVKRILAPAINAFESYDQIKRAILDHYSDQLVLLALGSTATVLASDLARNNIWALDIGHLDIEYEWFLCKAKDKIAISGKFVQETRDGKEVRECLDEEYLSQIVARVI